LQLDNILNAQAPESLKEGIKADDEMMFIIIHQTYELWFKQIIHELERLIQLIEAQKISHAYKTVDRIVQIQKVLVQQIDVLNTLSPDEFATFRDNLNPASGFQSHQFRLVEYLCGIKDEQYLVYHRHNPHAYRKLETYLNKKSLYDVFLKFLYDKGFNIPQKMLKKNVSESHQYSEEVKNCFIRIYQEKEEYMALYYLCERLIDMDDHFQLWRFRHIKMVERTIGQKTGTGGSLGAKYLKSTLEKRFFPELWEMRTEIGTY
ncbi:MAG: tryptophan 2,3-dioxygenase, partial [Calditrichaeota bacterium]|nr:tryptophan 2,3-dioxygenase [Calditrichota bacterium]